MSNLVTDWIEENGPVEVQLEGQDGNAFSILGRTTKALQRAGAPQEVVDAYLAEAQAKDYEHLLQVTLAITEPPEEAI